MFNFFELLGEYSLFKLLGSTLFAYLFALAVYRLYLSPIAHFPGSKITALTGWYETYLDVFKKGQFTFQVQRWHEQYGPIIRINPTEIHISDPDFYDVIYSSNTRFNKLEAYKYRLFAPTSLQATVEHDLHHNRRMALNPFFSKRQILNFSPYIQTCAAKLCGRLTNEYRRTSKIVKLDEAWGAFVTDVVVYYVLGTTYDFLAGPDFMAPFTSSSRDLAYSVHLTTHFPWILWLFKSIPDSLLGLMDQPITRTMLQFQSEIKAQISKIKDVDHRADNSAIAGLIKSKLPPDELSPIRLEHEAQALIGAAMDTTRTAFTIASFHIISNRRILQRLRQELTDAFPDLTKAPTLAELERLPYLTAIIQETIRLSYGVTQRLPRASQSAVQYGSYSIPPGVPFSMTNYIMHHDERIFPSSHTFLPERWLNSPKAPNSDKPLSKYLVSFSKGTRMCLGINLAYAELYIGLASVFRHFEFELVDAESDDMAVTNDFFVAHIKAHEKGVKALVK